MEINKELDKLTEELYKSMSRVGLVEKEITDKNGKRTTRWVKPGVSSGEDSGTPKTDDKVEKRANKTPESKPKITAEERKEKRIAQLSEKYPHLSDTAIRIRVEYKIPFDATDVKVIENDPKILAEFKDSRGRTQKRYTEEYQEKASNAKFARIENLDKSFDDVRGKVEDLLKSKGMGKEKVSALIVRLIDKCYFRIGNEKYSEDNGTYGITTMRRGHFAEVSGKMEFKYVGKKSVDQHKIAEDAGALEVIREMQQLEGYDEQEHLFVYQDSSGNLKPISDRDMRDFLKAWGLKPKDFRTYHATRLCAEKLSELGVTDDEKVANKNIKEAVEYTAKFLGHTPEICRKSYISGKVIEAYRQKIVM